MASKADVAAKQAQEAARQRNLEAAQAKVAAAQEVLSTAQSSARTTTGQSIFDVALAGISNYGLDDGAARGLAAMSARYGLQAADLNAYTGENIGRNISEQTKAEQAALDTATSLVNQYSTPIQIPTEDPMSTDTRDAYALIEDTLNMYGLSELSSVIKGYMLQGLGPEQAKLLIKQDPIYKARFRGNQVRLDSGLNALTEAEYLGLEDTYSQVMKQYGLGDYFGTTRAARQTKLADIIGGDISAVELKSRISTVVDRVNNADPGIKAQLKEFYPGITETDLVKYFLDPKQTLPQLEEKVTSAEIGAAATAQGLNTNMTSASDLARYGIDRAAAIKGYATIGGLLPEAKKLSGIYGEAGIDYTQTTAEQEVFKGNASAERKRKQLAALESAQFGGSAGLGSAGLSTTYLRKSSSGGQF